MKNNVKITNLTQVHVGSGETLHKNTDFVVKHTDDGKDSDIFVIDPDLVGQLIGDDAYVLQQWVTSIEKGDTNSFFDHFLHDYKISEYSKRRITNFAGDKDDMTLKECMHDGMGRPYIPGSSIKGAIRTVIVTYLADKLPVFVKEQMINTLRKGSGKIEYVDEDGKHTSAEDFMLGDTPNENLMRFFRVGDAFYDNGSEIAVTQVSINERQRQNLMDRSRSQVVEAIASDETSSFSLAIDKAKYEKVFANRSNQKELKGMKALADDFATLPTLFKLINSHTKKLVEWEISYWGEETQYTGAENYITSMQEILDSIIACKDGECVLRIGQATGWRFITGAWTAELENFYKKVVPIARPNNINYEDYIFPKTRRLDDESYLFGFVKLSLQ